MGADRFTWLHLTDFHYGLSGQDFLWPVLREPFFRDLKDVHKRTGPWQAVLFTGDCVQSGKDEEFDEMERNVLVRLWDKLTEFGSGDAVLLAVPGNHDLFRPSALGDDAAVDTLLDRDCGFGRIANKFWDNPTGCYRKVINHAFAPYKKWWINTPRRPPALTDGVLPGDFACTLPCGDRRIGIVGLNTAFLQLQGGDYRGCLAWNVQQIHHITNGAPDDWINKHDVCLLLTHQGPHWLTPDCQEHGNGEIAPAGRFAVHLFGHEHETKVTSHTDGAGIARRQFQGRSVFGLELFGEPPTTVRSHGYAVGRIDFNKRSAKLRFWPRRATRKADGWIFDPDTERVNLQSDQGTKPETIDVRAPIASSTRITSRQPTRAPRIASMPGPFTPHSTLPQRQPFFGRKKQLEDIAKALHPDNVGWGVVLDGLGGIGKTALAIEAAHRAPTEYYSLKLFVTAKERYLRPEGERKRTSHWVADFDALLTETGLALGHENIPVAQPKERADLVRHALASHHCLLVFDNLESFSVEDRRRLYDLLEVLPRTCRSIVTTRHRDDVSARTLRLGQLDREAADQLLQSLSERRPSLLGLTAEDHKRLYQETGGNPLLLTWTVCQLDLPQGRCRTVDEAVVRLQEAYRLQNENKKNNPLEFSFGDLLDTRTEDETLVLAALAHFTEPAPVEWLLPLVPRSRNAVLTTLHDLRDCALFREVGVPSRWLLESLAARFLCQRRPEAIDATGKRLAEHAYALILEHGGEGKKPFTELSNVWPTIQAALPLLIAGDNTRLQEACDKLGTFLEFTGRWDEMLLLSRAAEDKAASADNDNRAGDMAKISAWTHIRRADPDALNADLDRIARYWKNGDVWQSALLLRFRGKWNELRNAYSVAIETYEDALKLARSVDPENFETVIILAELGIAKRKSGDLVGAKTTLREALDIAKKTNDEIAVARYTGHLADVYLDLHDWPQAERLAREARNSSQGDLAGIAVHDYRLAKALLQQERAAEALDYARAAVAGLTRFHDNRLGEAESTLAACEAAALG